MDNNTLFWGSHGGGYGAVFGPLLHFLHYCDVNNKKIAHNCENPWCDVYKTKDTIMHNFLLSKSRNENVELFHKTLIPDYIIKSENDKDTDLKIKKVKDWAEAFFGSKEYYTYRTTYNTFKNSNIKKELCSYFESCMLKYNWKLDYKPSNSIIIHVRLWDEAPVSLAGPNRAPQAGAKQNRFIGEDRLLKLITYLNNTYKEHEILLCTTPNLTDINICKNIIKKTDINCRLLNDTPQETLKILNPYNKNDIYERFICGNEELDIWRMMNCDILIMSPSMFPMIAGFLHRGSKVYLPHFHTNWKHFYDWGYSNENVLHF